MENKVEVWVVKDNENILRPLAGIWLNKNYGEDNAKEYQRKNKQGDVVVLCTLTEIKIN